MDVHIRKYNPKQDYAALSRLIQSEGEEWLQYLEPQYKNALKNSITYVAILEKKLCGYSRSLNDSELFIWVIDLLVHRDHRGQAVGKKLMECIVAEYPNLDVLVMSDVDPYYDKLGYNKEGSIFKVNN